MRRVKLPYGHEFREIEGPEPNLALVAGPKQVPPLTDVGAAIASAIRHPNRTRRRIRITLLTDHISPSEAWRTGIGSTPHFAEALERVLARQGCPAQNRCRDRWRRRDGPIRISTALSACLNSHFRSRRWRR